MAFARPACFADERDWAAWLNAYRFAARGNDLKRLQRGLAPNHCEDCDACSEHRQRAVRAGTCIPIRVEETTDAAT
ncbi:hypothetical protein [Methylibium petroleiphilum]